MLTILTDLLYYGLLLDAVFMSLTPVHWIIGIPIEFAVQFALIALCVGILFLLKGKPARALLLFVFAVYFSWPSLILWYPYATQARSQEVAQDLRGLRILSVNVNRHNMEYQALLDQIRSNDPDVIIIQEANASWVSAIQEQFSNVYPHGMIVPSADHRGMAVFSKLNIEKREEIQLGPQSPPVLKLSIGDPVLTLFAVHALSPISDSWARERDAFIRQFADLVQAQEGTVIVAGDFNTTVNTPAFRSFSATGRLSDARAGFGWQPSWLREYPVALSLDHILYRGEVRVTDFRVGSAIGSDHRPLYADFVRTSAGSL